MKLLQVDIKGETVADLGPPVPDDAPDLAINAADATREPVAQRECKAPNASTKQWLITTVEHHFYQVFDLFDSLGFKDTEERWQYMRRFERAMKLIKQGPDEPTP